jgi:hypothetical protein
VEKTAESKIEESVEKQLDVAAELWISCSLLAQDHCLFDKFDQQTDK